MLRRIYDSMNSMVVIPLCGVLYGLVRAAGAYTDSVEAGAAMTAPQILGYTLGAVFVWGLAGLTVAWLLERLERRGARKQQKTAEPRQQG
ncbi:hypothetical protein [Vannielia litorea]|uniref:Uncharacterized protein n=1 Tax=Vannielia litorea TaxID=1217970 RepID=A0A1N6EB28_9RHOB|nr:hypothetical protein [Vannielia litorea]SIN80242.1 hypothetical protein SAMN05444002_0540 [Vannielia litorea]